MTGREEFLQSLNQQGNISEQYKTFKLPHYNGDSISQESKEKLMINEDGGTELNASEQGGSFACGHPFSIDSETFVKTGKILPTNRGGPCPTCNHENCNICTGHCEDCFFKLCTHCVKGYRKLQKLLCKVCHIKQIIKDILKIVFFPLWLPYKLLAGK